MNSLRKTISLINLNLKTFGAQFKFERASDKLHKFNTHYPNDSFSRLAKIITNPEDSNKGATPTEISINQALALKDFHRFTRQRSLIETECQKEKIRLGLMAKAKKDLNAGKTPKLELKTSTIKSYFKSRVSATYKQHGVPTTPSAPLKHQATLKIA